MPFIESISTAERPSKLQLQFPCQSGGEIASARIFVAKIVIPIPTNIQANFSLYISVPSKDGTNLAILLTEVGYSLAIADTILLHLGKLLNLTERSRQGSHSAKESHKNECRLLEQPEMDFQSDTISDKDAAFVQEESP